ncbi:retrovirus-related pol polyprotein from transposon TNT 1-94 [Tanacetum coccineum]
MHNNIVAAGSRDRPPILATGRYAQWQSRFLRYIDTRPNGNSLRKCILQGPYTPSTVIIPAAPATDDTPAVPERTAVETILNMSPENKAHYELKKEAIHLLLTGIRDEIHSTVDACKTAHEMLTAIERFMESYYSRFYKMMNEMIRNNLTVAMMQVNVQFLQQLQPEWSRIAKNANPLALVAAALPYPDPYYQAPKSHKPYAPTTKQSSSTRSNASTKFKGKKIAKLITPLSESASEEDSDLEQAQRDKDMQKNLALIAKYFKKIYKPTNNNIKTSSNSINKNVDTSLHYKNENQTGKKPKRVKDSTYHKEKMLLCKQAEKGVPLQAKKSDWLADTDEEIEEQELEAHYSYMAKIQEVPTADSGTDYEPLEQTDQNARDERAMLANLKLDVDENKKIQKQLKKANTSLAHELKECKSILAETSRTLGESNSIQDKREQYHEIQDLKAQLQDKNIAICELKKLIEKCKGKSKETKFDKPPVVRQPNAQRIPKPSVLGKPTPFSDSLERKSFSKTKSVPKTNVLEGVIHRTNVSRPQLRSTQTKDKIVQLILFIIDSRCTKHMTGNLKLLCKFVKKYLGTVRFGNDQFAQILGYEDLVQGNITVNKKDVVIGLPKLRYVKDQLCSFCEVSKAKRSSFKTRVVPSLKGRLNLLHIDLCGPISKDETLEVLKDFLTMIQRNLQAIIKSVRIDRGTEFLNKTLNAFFKEEGIKH